MNINQIQLGGRFNHRFCLKLLGIQKEFNYSLTVTVGIPRNVGGPVISYHHHLGGGNVAPPPLLPTRRRGRLRRPSRAQLGPITSGMPPPPALWDRRRRNPPHHGSPKTRCSSSTKNLANPTQSPVGYHKTHRTSDAADASGTLPNIRAASSPTSRRISAGTRPNAGAITSANNLFSATNPGPTPHTFELNKPGDPNTTRREKKRIGRNSASRASPTPGAHPSRDNSDSEEHDEPPIDEDEIMADLQQGIDMRDGERDADREDEDEDETARHRPFHAPRADDQDSANPSNTGNGAGNTADNGGDGDGGGGPPPRVEVPRVILPIPYTRPTEAAFLARPPKTRGSPHRKNPAYDLPLAGPDDMPVRVSFQPTEGNLDRPVIDGWLAVTNVPTAFISTLDENPDEFGVIIPFLGGCDLIAAHGPANLVTSIVNVLTDAGLMSPDDLEVIPLDADKPPSKKDPYAAPWILVRIATFIADRDLAFHIIRYNPGLRTWTVALYTVSSMGGHDSNAKHLRWLVAELILNNKEVRRAYQRAAGTGDSRNILSRLLDFARTVHVVWNEHSKHWCVYAEPCAPDYAGWESVRIQMCAIPLHHAKSLRTFKPVADVGTKAPFCLNCKNDDHLHYGCRTRLDDPEQYWGPQKQLGFFTEGILAKATKSNASSNNRGGGGSSRSGGQGGGGPRGGATCNTQGPRR
ncbi:hypothetical protein B0H16DRAFT_1453194 [Mycena metata]|uniref:Uncharacterized protein n=1 Tax=Mycena metata TaxID=1033252 RepID=A0AAD7JNG8_9AGAR|nr:hypothetical protein B0H16DRAFT_1453194 [Mycena metata]